jgi:hypothetical protein
VRTGAFVAPAAVIALAVAAAAIALPACIRRYPAPDEPLEPQMPYSAVATWRAIELPPPPGDGQAAAEPLPARALRLAIGPGPGDVFADTAMVDPPESAETAEAWEAAIALLSARSEPVVVLADPRALAADASICSKLQPLAPRVLVAVGRSGHGEDGDEARVPDPSRNPGGAASRDPLAAAPMGLLCPAG